jgi:hypothetical protein
MKIVFTLIVLFFNSQLYATEITWNFNDLYTVNANGFASIISDARNHFDTFPNDTITVHINAGSYQINGGDNIGINFNGGLLSENAQGRLIFQGAGMYETTLTFTDKNDDMIKGNNVYHLEFRDIFMTRPQYSVSQGTIVSVSAGEVVLDIEQGFPDPYSLFAIEGGAGRFDAGRYLRKYDNSNKLDPLVILDNNRQISWGWRNGAPVYPVEDTNVPNRWTIFLNNASTVVSYYAPGDYLGIKSKSEGHIYWFSRGSDLVFRNIRWRNSSRGLVRGGFSNVGLYGCRIEREDPINGQMPCMSTPSGGPQMNQDGDPVSTNMILENCYIDSPGDDCVAFFKVDCGKVINSTLRNSFARGFLVTPEANNICGANNIVENNPYQIDNGQPLVEITDCGTEILDITATDSYLSNSGILYTESTYFADIYDDPSCDTVKYINLTIEPLSTDDNKLKEQKRISYPSVTENIIKFSKTLSKVQVFNINGIKVLDISNKNGIQFIDVLHLSSGLYFIKLDESVVEKFIRK